MSTEQIANELAQITVEIESILRKVGKRTNWERAKLEGSMCRFTYLRNMQRATAQR